MVKEWKKFLTEEECSQIIGMGEMKCLEGGSTFANSTGYRKAKVAWIHSNPIVNKIRSRISELSQYPIENQENIHFVKYGIGGEYKLHFDGGNRVKTALVYLNDGYVGGETEFPKLNLKIKPEIGKLIIWDNLNPDGSDDDTSFHAGLPVELGTKYIAVIWIKK
jgi:prolyl 4-hydroxylase